MAKSSLEKEIEKSRKDAQKRAREEEKRHQKTLQQAQQEAIRQQAYAIVMGQPLIAGMRIIDNAAEEIFKIILNNYDGNENRLIINNDEVFPEAYHNSLRLEFDKLKMYGLISNYQLLINGNWQVTLNPQGITYFEDKEQATALEKDRESRSTKIRKTYDVFISHASQDKSDYVDELYAKLRKLGINIFYDSESISWGDNWKQKILNGAESSEFAIIVISQNFFGREWTEKELKEFLQRQNESGQKIVLPLLHGITHDDLKTQYPELEPIQGIDTEKFSKEEITIYFAKELIERLR